MTTTGPASSVGESAAPRPTSGWAIGLGVIALVYALAGILVNGLGLLLVLLSDPAAAAASTGPIQWALGGLAILLGVVLAIGSIGMLRRRRWGPRIVVCWVVARLLLLPVGAVYGWLTLPDQVDARMAMMEERMAEARGGRDSSRGSRSIRVEASGSSDRQSMLNWSKMLFAGGVAVTAAFPVVAGWVLSNRRRREEIAAW